MIKKFNELFEFKDNSVSDKELLEMANASEKVTGIKNVVLWLGPPPVSHGHRIKVSNIPAYFYKVILDYTEPEIKGIGFIIPNQASQEPLQHFVVTIDSVEKVTGIDFFYQLPKDHQRIIESSVDLSEWHWTSAALQQKTGTHNSGTVYTGSTRCTGLTKKGTQCTRMTSSPNGKCWQHGGN